MKWLCIVSIVLAIFALCVTAMRTETRGVFLAQLRPFTFHNPPDYGLLSSGEQENNDAPAEPPPHDARQASVVQKHPNDFALQLADAAQPKNGDLVRAARALWPRFVGEPAAYSPLIRALCRTQPLKFRNRDWAIFRSRLEKTPPDPKFMGVLSPPRSELMTEMLEAAETGEILEEDNAYFPAMRMVALFAMRRDGEAMVALRRAGNCPRWDDYAGSEATARTVLLEKTYGPTPAIARFALHSTVLFPHYAQLRNAARLTIIRAAALEAQNRNSDGWAIRRDVIHIGTIMRTQNSSFIGTLVGIAVTNIASGSAGNVGLVPKRANETPDELFVRRRNIFLAYLRRIGKNQAAAAYEQESKAGCRTKELYRAAEARSIVGLDRVKRHLRKWGETLLLLINAASLLILTGIAALLLRAPTIRDALPLRVSTRWAIVLAFVPSVLSTLFSASKNTTLFFVGLFLAFTILTTWIVTAGFRWRTLKQDISVAFATTAAMWPVFIPFFAVFPAFLPEMGTLASVVTPTGMVLLAFLVPLLLMLFSGLSRLHEMPLTAGIVRGVHAFGVPVTMLLIVWWCVACVPLAQAENQWGCQLSELQQNEARYYARLIGETPPP